MSALGQKQTFERASGMSALPPKADILRGDVHVHKVPKADLSLRPIRREQLQLKNAVDRRQRNADFGGKAGFGDFQRS